MLRKLSFLLEGLHAACPHPPHRRTRSSPPPQAFLWGRSPIDALLGSTDPLGILSEPFPRPPSCLQDVSSTNRSSRDLPSVAKRDSCHPLLQRPPSPGRVLHGRHGLSCLPRRWTTGPVPSSPSAPRSAPCRPQAISVQPVEAHHPDQTTDDYYT